MGHPCVCGVGEERETAGSLAALGMTTRKASAKTKAEANGSASAFVFAPDL